MYAWRISVIISSFLLSTSATPVTASSHSPSSSNYTITWNDGPDVSACKVLAPADNPWRIASISPNPFPDFPSNSVSNEAVLNGTATTATVDSVNSSSLNETDIGLDWECEQIADYNFNRVTGYVRTPDATIDNYNVHYWLSWRADVPGKLTFWRSKFELGPWYSKIYTSPLGGESRGAVQIVGGKPQSRLRVDVQLPEGIGHGGSGRITLYAFNLGPARPITSPVAFRG